MITAESHAQGVRLTADVAAAQEWMVTRTDGFPVRGGTGTGPSTFIDVAAPVNEPVTYVLAAGDDSGQVTVTRRAEGHMLSSLNGLSQANFRWLGDGEMPVEPRMYQADVPGRTRPVLRLQPVAADGGISVTARASGEANRAMRSLLLANRPLLLFHDRSKCEIPECDIPAVSCVFPASRVQNPRTGHISVATRDWQLEFLTIDVPGLASRVGIGVWEQLEAEAMTWADVETLAMAWDEFENGGWING